LISVFSQAGLEVSALSDGYAWVRKRTTVPFHSRPRHTHASDITPMRTAEHIAQRESGTKFHGVLGQTA
tara:strand:+ start:1254 stop:1460 length:207 start_codon:yes stop_codon:yes gene_type:complete